MLLIIIVIIVGVIHWHRHGDRLLSRLSNPSNSNNNPPQQRNSAPPPSHSPVPANALAGETGPMIYFANNPHNLPDKEYRFSYKRVGGTWRAYILRTPSYAGRSINTVPHRLTDAGRPYICWSGSVGSLEEIQTVSRVWANRAQDYLATGTGF